MIWWYLYNYNQRRKYDTRNSPKDNGLTKGDFDMIKNEFVTLDGENYGITVA